MSKGTGRVKNISSNVGKRPTSPKQRGPVKKHQLTKSSASARQDTNISKASTTRQLQDQQHGRQVKYNKPVPRNFIGFCNWLALGCKGRLQTCLDDNRSDVPIEPISVEPVTSTAEVDTEKVLVLNEEDVGIDWDQLRAIMASSDQDDDNNHDQQS